MCLASGGFHVKVTLLDEMEEAFSPLTGPEGTEEMRDNMHYRQYTVNDGETRNRAKLTIYFCSDGRHFSLSLVVTIHNKSPHSVIGSWKESIER